MSLRSHTPNGNDQHQSLCNTQSIIGHPIGTHAHHRGPRAHIPRVIGDGCRHQRVLVHRNRRSGLRPKDEPAARTHPGRILHHRRPTRRQTRRQARAHQDKYKCPFHPRIGARHHRDRMPAPHPRDHLRARLHRARALGIHHHLLPRDRIVLADR